MRMKLLLSASLTLLAVLPALCWPMEDNTYNFDQQGGGLAREMEAFSNGIGTESPEPPQQQNFYYAESQGMCNLSYRNWSQKLMCMIMIHTIFCCACILVSGADTEPELPPDVVEEIKKQLEEGQQRALQQNFYYADEQGSG